MPPPKQTVNLLILSSEMSEAERITVALRESGLPVQGVATPNVTDLERLLRQRTCEIILCCSYDHAINLDEVLTAHRKLKQDIPLLIIADSDNFTTTLTKSFREGVRDVIKRFEYERLKWVITREFTDLQERRIARGLSDRINLCEQRSQELIAVTDAAVAFVMLDGMHLDANPAYLTQFGFNSLDDLQATPFLDLVIPEQQRRFRDLLRGDLAHLREPLTLNFTCVRTDDTQFAANLLIAPAVLENESCLRLIIPKERAPEVDAGSKSPHEASYATKRIQFLTTLDNLIGKERQVKRPFAIYYLQLRAASELLRDLGFTQGSNLFDEFEKTLLLLINKKAILLRISDNGFGLIVPETEETAAKALADKILAEARLPEGIIGKKDGKPHCEIGYYVVMGRSSAPEDVLNAVFRLCNGYTMGSQASSADPKRLTSLAARDKQESAVGENAIVDRIQEALNVERFRLIYQPIVSLMGDNQENYSVLIRMFDHQEQLYEANEFIEPAIRAGLIESIDQWTIRTAIQVLGQQHQAGNKIVFFINLSEDTFRNPEIIVKICDWLREFKVRGNWLTFQFQEELINNNLASISKLIEALKKIRCRIAVNRFGTLERPELLLQGLPVDFVLLQPSYAQGLAIDQEKQKRLLQLATLAREFNIKSVVTGVEDANTLTILWSAGVDYVQGNFLQRPSPTLEVPT